jgi:hypothetical protein
MDNYGHMSTTKMSHANAKSVFSSRVSVLLPYKNIFLQVIKKLKIILEIFINTSHNPGKSQPKLLFILG